MLSQMLTLLPGDKGKSIEAKLSEQECRVLRAMGAGWSSVEISHTLGISSKTVDTHKMRIRRKLGLGDHTELLVLALWLHQLAAGERGATLPEGE